MARQNRRKAQRPYLTVFALILGVALPGAGFYALYHITDNPAYQPLGLTRERLALVSGQSDYISIIIDVDWGRDRTSGISQLDLRDAIAGALIHRTDDFVFRFNQVQGTAIHVTYSVGPNHYGPYAIRRLVDGINPALVALDMTQKAAR